VESASRFERAPSVLNSQEVQPRGVRGSAVPDTVAGVPGDPRIEEYLELHGRAVDGSARSTMMPWSALQQIAN
jgi:hypothetical protein